MRKLLISLTLAASVVLAGITSVAGTAAAAPTTVSAVPATAGLATAVGSCASGNFCVWYLRNYSGPIYQWYGSDSNWTDNWFSNGAVVNDNDESWADHGSVCYHCDRVAVYRDINYGGGVTIYLTRGQGKAVDTAAEDRGSSHRWY